MSRPVYREVPGGFFHVTSRGNAKQKIFRDEADFRGFLLELELTAKRHRWRCVSYCLMPNHFHLLLQTPDPTLAEGMRDLKSQHAQSFHRRHGTDGALFRARYWRQLVQENAYLLAAAVYIAKNPVRASLVENPADWPWSSCGAVARGERTFTELDPVLEILSPRRDAALRDFQELVCGTVAEPPFDPTLPIVGEQAFVRAHAPSERPAREVAKRAWEQARPSLEVLGTHPEEAFIRLARIEHHYTLREIAGFLGCSQETVRRRLRVWDVET